MRFLRSLLNTRLFKLTAFSLSLIIFNSNIAVADSPVKREMRSAWVATVWRLDWPTTVITTTGNQDQIEKQKKELTTMLDSMAVNNMNAVNFQVRSRADAFYKSSYEPWSSDLVSKRGMDPGYDPLAFCVEECHKRGMECHAWINPYRYESVSEAWSGQAGDYRAEHPDWIVDVNGAAIFNPGKSEVTQRICDIISEICHNYDIDGVLFDDYFYLQGISDQDAEQYTAYKQGGGTLELGDWRRANVNDMVDQVYNTIKGIKPWVRFGISPAGIACTDIQVAIKHGIDPCPTGSDWQYNGIYSDPIAWIKNHSLDFISPQIYWTIGNSGCDYTYAAKWWSEIANKFGRHFYSSHSISSLTASSKAPGMSEAETSIANPIMRASGPNNNTFAEYANEVRLNREYTLDDAPGSIFYSAKFLYRTAPKFAHYLHTTVFDTPSLLPALTWQPVNAPGNISGLSRSGNILSWQGFQNVRYTIYAVPASVSVSDFDREAQYLLGVSYESQYTIPDNRLSGYNYAVCVLDRYGNEYSPIFLGMSPTTLVPPTLTSPVGGVTIEMPFDFTWQAVDNASAYRLQVATDRDMTNLIYTTTVSATSVNTTNLGVLPSDQPLYWRVSAVANNATDANSTVQEFKVKNLEILTPVNLQADVPLSPVISWNFNDREVTIQIARDQNFTEMVYTADSKQGSHRVADNVLGSFETYYLRLLYSHGGQECVTPATRFSTIEITPSVPTISYPANTGILHCNEAIVVNPVQGLRKMRVEISASSTFPVRSSYVSEQYVATSWVDSKNGEDIKISSKNLVDGNTYYVRVRGSYNTVDGLQHTEFCSPVQFTYSSEIGSVNDITDDNDALFTINNGQITINAQCYITATAHDMTGRVVAVLFDGEVDGSVQLSTDNLVSGVYVIMVNNCAYKYIK